jgi:hypothetical protein
MKMTLDYLIAEDYNREIVNQQEGNRTVILSIRSHFIKRAIIEPTVAEKSWSCQQEHILIKWKLL